MKAFPTRGWNSHEETISEGMDLRDYFAAKAMQKIIWKKGEEAKDAEDCYVIADAMMKAREMIFNCAETGKPKSAEVIK
jgi:hypothetical protein